MTEERLRILLEGLLYLWAVPGEVDVTSDTPPLEARITHKGELLAELRCSRQSFGMAWEVTVPGERRRSHPSFTGVIKTLRAALAPERPVARILFASGAA